MEWQYIVLLFFAMSVLGWLMEVCLTLVEFRRFINRGFLIGPYCPIYGVGAVMIVSVMERYTGTPVGAFLILMLLCGSLEYVTSYAMEKLFHARWWDYSDKRFNIDGRICAETLIPFGVMGMLVNYVLKPVLFGWLDTVPEHILTPVCVVLLVAMAVDAAVSTTILGKIRKSANLTGGDDTETLTRAVRETLSRQSALLRRTLSAFPYARIYNNRLLEQLRNTKRALLEEASAKKRMLREELRLRDRKLRAELSALRQQARGRKK